MKLKINPWPKLYAETRRGDESAVRVLNELGAALTSLNTCKGVHTKGRDCIICRPKEAP